MRLILVVLGATDSGRFLVRLILVVLGATAKGSGRSRGTTFKEFHISFEVSPNASFHGKNIYSAKMRPEKGFRQTLYNNSNSYILLA